jgi:hypothetical protein
VDVLEVLRRTEEEIEDRPEEGWHQSEEARHCDEPGILDPPVGVLVDPVGRREPQDDDEEDGEVAGDRPRVGVEEASEQVVVLRGRE